MPEPSQFGLAKARDQLGELFRRVADEGEVIFLARRGRTVATLITPERLAALEMSVHDSGFLADVSHALITTLDLDGALARLARMLAGWLGDVCLVDLFGEAGWRCVAAATSGAAEHIDPAELVRIANAAPPGELGLRSPVRLSVNETGAGIEGTARWERVLAAAGAGQGVVAPLAHRGRLLGAIVIASCSRPVDDRVIRLARNVARRASVIVENDRLYAEQRTVAERLQRYLLTEPAQFHGVQLAARYAPAARGVDVGGDWYDVFRLPDGGIALTVGDVVGHDLDAVVLMSQLRTLLRGVAWLVPADPASVLVELERVAAGLGLKAMATMILAVLRPLTDGRWLLRWANAGHLPPLIVNDGTEPTFLERRADPLLGVFVGALRTTHEVEIAAPATLLLYTDGLVERRSEPLDRSLAGLRRTVTHHLFDDVHLLCEGLLAGIDEDHEDDIVLLAARLLSRT